MQVFTTLKLPEVNSYSELLIFIFFFYHTPLPDGTPTITVLLNFVLWQKKISLLLYVPFFGSAALSSNRGLSAAELS